MGKRQTHLKEMDRLPTPSSGSDGESLESFNKDLCKLREEFESASEGQAAFYEDVFTKLKDPTIMFGDFERRIAALELVVKKILAKLDFL